MQRPASPGRPAPSVATADQCRALVNWASILDREYPAGMARMVSPDRARNLFRDEYFVPFYGRPFSQTTDAERVQYLSSVLRGCGLNQLSQPEIAVIQKYRMVLEPPFQYGSATVVGQQIAKSLAERQALARSRDEMLRALNTIPATLEGIERLESFRQKGERELTPLFPSEKQRFLQTVTDRRKLFAPALAEQLMQFAAAIPAGPDGAKAITTLRARYEPALSDADPALQMRVSARIDELIVASLRDQLTAQKAKLAAMPAGIDGALALAGWQREFDIQFAGVNAGPVQALREDGVAKRRECLKAGLPEFQSLVAQYPKPGRGGLKADELLAKLFPAGEPPMAESGAYTAALTQRTRQIREEEEAKAFREEQLKARAAAKQPVKSPADPNLNPCDALAGHPGDAGHKGDGVSDAELNAAEAIKACTLAVKQQPKVARFRFQLGRAYWLAKQYDKAVESLSAAQGMEYAPAYHYLGMAYEQGKVKGEPADKTFAADLYKMAIAGGFDAGAMAIGAMPDAPPVPIIEKADDLDATQLKEPAFVKAVFAGDFDAIQGRRRWVLVWARGIQSFLSLDPNEYDPTCLKLYDASLDGKIDYEQTGAGDGKVDMATTLSEAMRLLRTASQDPGRLVAESERNDQIVQNGVDDISVLSEDYGGCEGPVVRRFYRNLARFIKEKPQPKPPAVVSGSHDRPPVPGDLKGVSDPALSARLQQELQGLAAQEYVLTECTYSSPEKTFAYWKNKVPVLSDSLRLALAGIMPISLAHCPRYENNGPLLWSVFKPAGRTYGMAETGPTLQQVPMVTIRGTLPPNQRNFQQEAAAMQTPLVACKSPFDGPPVLYWRTSLPRMNGQVNEAFLKFAYEYWKVLPAAVNSCPAGSSGSSTYLLTKEY